MRKLALSIATAAALLTAAAVPAMAQVGFYAGPGGFSIGVGGPYYGYDYPNGYYDYYGGGPGIVVRPGWNHPWHHGHHWHHR